jgi:hypothetical protein
MESISFRVKGVAFGLDMLRESRWALISEELYGITSSWLSVPLRSHASGKYCLVRSSECSFLYIPFCPM